jgi:hypothetical protein
MYFSQFELITELPTKYKVTIGCVISYNNQIKEKIVTNLIVRFLPMSLITCYMFTHALTILKVCYYLI